jgi:hypothetical protein
MQYKGLIPRALFLGEIFRLFLLNCEKQAKYFAFRREKALVESGLKRSHAISSGK